MSWYRKIDVRIWSDEKFTRLSVDEKIVAIYCLTNRQVNRCGLFVFSPALAAEELGTLPQTFLKRFGNVRETFRWGWDERVRTLYFPTWWKYNHPENPNVLKACLSDLEGLPKTPLLAEFSSNLRYLPERLHQTFLERMGERYPERMGDQEQEQEQEQEQKQEKKDCTEPPPASSVPPAVLVFPTVGSGTKTWELTQDQISRWAELHPGIDVLAECRKALSWCEANAAKRKSARGMTAFLVRWLGKAQDECTRTGRSPKQMSFAAAAMARNDAILAAATGKTPELPPRETTPLAIENAK